MVRFSDIADPRTVEKVDPEDLVAAFGQGVKLRRVIVQLTDEPVTTGIEKRLRWMAKYRNRHFDGTSTIAEEMTSDDLAIHLSPGFFSTEFAR